MKKLFTLVSLLLIIQMGMGQQRFAEFGDRYAPIDVNFKQIKEQAAKKAIKAGVTTQHKQIQLVNRTKNRDVPADKAEIILEAHDVWNTPMMGYHMILDANHNTYDNMFFGYGTAYYTTNYADFEYTIPSGTTTPNDPFLHDGVESILIPAGTYDYIIGYPEPGVNVLNYAYGPFAIADDFDFQGGYSYHYIVSYVAIENGGFGDEVDLFVDIDAALDKLEVPANSLDLTNSEPISIIIRNRGISPISNFSVFYQVDEESSVQETFSGTIPPGETANFTFVQKADFSAIQTYHVSAWVELPNDLIPLNNRKEGKCKHLTLNYTPYHESFSSEEAFLEDWIVLDNNNDNTTWEYYMWLEGPDGLQGAVACPGNWQGNDDYLISSPIYLESGTNNISFYLKCVNPSSTELLDVLVGNSSDVTQMEVVASYSIDYSSWKIKSIDFTADEDGAYYFAFHGKSPNGMNIHLDDVKVDAGAYPISPILKIERLLLPYPNCDLSANSSIGVRITNEGTGSTSIIEMSYSIDNGTEIQETFIEVLDVDETADFYFTTTADLSTIAVYSVTVKVSTGDQEVSKTSTTTHYEPIEQVPFETNFQENINIETYWTPLSENSWQYDAMGGKWVTQTSGLDNGLLLRCLPLNHPFRIRIVYSGGGWSSNDASFYIAYGKPGTDIGTWEIIYEDDGIVSEKDIEFSTTTFNDPGYYSFIIVSNQNESSLGLFYFHISEIFDYDTRITWLSAPLAPYTPAKQIPYTGEYTVDIENRGLQQVTSINAAIYKDESILFGSSTPINLNPNETGQLVFSGSMPVVSVGSELHLSARLSQNETDEYDLDNVYNHTVLATDSILSMENITEFINGTGSYMGELWFGNIYELMAPDVLTSIDIGLAFSSWYEPHDMGVAIYTLKDDGLTVDYEVFSTTLERGVGGAIKNIPIEPRLLPAGKYYFEVRQLSYTNIGLTYEQNSQLCAYQNISGTLYPNFGIALSIRANFAIGAIGLEKDAKAISFTKPYFSNDLYSSEEIVAATVGNMGSLEITNMGVVCEVNGVNHTTSVSLRPHETKEVQFTVNMSEPGEYLVKVYTTLEGDQNMDNNSIFYSLTGVAEGDPYVLDFELCNDFEAGYEFNPRWWSIDRNIHDEVDAWWQFDYRHKEQPVGFIAFNRATTSPPMSDDNIPGFIPYSGNRFGAAFAPAYGFEGESDIWLISPKLKLGTGSSWELYVKSYQEPLWDAELERFNLLISTTDDNFDSFELLGEERRAPWEDWGKVEVDLSNYDNQDVFLALQYVSRVLQGTVMMVDDIHVKTTTSVENIINDSNDVHFHYDALWKRLIVSSNDPITQVNIYNISGHKMHQSNKLNTNSYQVYTTSYGSGVYVVTVSTSKKYQTFKFVVTQ